MPAPNPIETPNFKSLRRNIVGTEAFSDKISQTICFPVPDNGWFPSFRCGEFAIVETSDHEPRSGEFFLRRHENGRLAIVQLKIHDKNSPMQICGRGSRGIHWHITYGAQTAVRLDGKPANEFGSNGRFHMMDGPLPDKFMRPQIVGRVTGVLGAGERTLNWQGR